MILVLQNKDIYQSIVINIIICYFCMKQALLCIFLLTLQRLLITKFSTVIHLCASLIHYIILKLLACILCLLVGIMKHLIKNHMQTTEEMIEIVSRLIGEIYIFILSFFYTLLLTFSSLRKESRCLLTTFPFVIKLPLWLLLSLTN